jgi:HEAT repeat protein
VLADCLSDLDERIRFNAARALEKLGPAAKPAKEALEKALRDEDEDVRYWASEALKNIKA